MRAVTDVADRIARYARVLGYSASVSASAVSESRYVHVWTEDLTYTIRVSRHDLPPSYAPSDMDVDQTYTRPGGCRWTSAVAWLAQVAGRDVPGPVAAAIHRRERAEAGARQRERVESERAAERAAAAAALDAAVARCWPDRWAAAQGSGAGAREARRLLRRAYEAAAAVS